MTIPADIQVSPSLLAEAFSVQEHLPPTERMRGFGRSVTRGPLLPPNGFREREWALRQYYHHNYSTLFPSVIAGIVKNIGSIPFTLIGDDTAHWQEILSRNWESLIPKAVKDYFRHDGGTWVEFIAPGDPRFPPLGGIVGFNVLDSLRVYPTGNPTYPAIYYDIKGRMHQLHRTRVYQIVDNEESEEDLAGYGECALSRGIAAVTREILINRYIEQYLDDKPMPGIMLAKNANPQQIENALDKMHDARETDSGGEWGRVMWLHSLDPAETIAVESVTLSKAPENFDYSEYTNIIARQLAAAIGVDIQDFWELSGGGIGSGSQSQVLAQKSRGKAIGRLLKAFERMFNQALPPSVEFRWQYRDPQEDDELANKASAWMNTVQGLIAAGVINTVEGRQVLANQIEAMKDVLIDEDGNLKPLLPDAPAETAPMQAEDTDGGTAEVIQTVVEELASKDFATTAREFEHRFSSFVRVANAQNFNAAILRATFRGELYQAGAKAYEDGLVEGGADVSNPGITELVDRNRRVVSWFALQNSYIERFVYEVSQGRIEGGQIAVRAGLWVNKSLREIYYDGLADADGESFYEWELGGTIEHCKTCSLLNGQKHRMKQWRSSGLLPQSHDLECGGWNCLCRLAKTKGPQRGRLPGQPSLSIWQRFFRKALGGLAA